MSADRYNKNSREFRDLSAQSPLSGAPNYYHASPQRQAILKKQRFDHAARDRRIRNEKKKKLSRILALRSKRVRNPKKPTTQETASKQSTSKVFKKFKSKKSVPAKV